MKRITWHNIATFFESGDLTPFAVLISIAHYGPVLAAHGENSYIAYLIGTMIDMIHFRTVRRAVMPHDTKTAAAINWGVALLTTLMAAMYHWRFYNGDLLLALPIPLGVAILAYHAADKSSQDYDTVCHERDAALSRVDTLMMQIDKLEAGHVKNGVNLDKLPERLADYVTLVADGIVPNGEFTTKHGVGETTIKRANSVFLK